ncbi:hypothetical protein [Nocardiopsis sp. FR26]|uniref:hypothetical protein n=1 Tax=Nocardiopsis sp. FR26 TaxID=2605987 RepID=UPI00135973E7|nr:hypothetical protein [Nocardiopsis sp. FR26]
MAQAGVPYLVGHAEIAFLFQVARQTSQKWKTDGTLPRPDVVVSGNPYWLLTTVQRIEGSGGRKISAERLNAYKASIAVGYEVDQVDQLPVIIGAQETARLLGTTPQTIARWRSRHTLPEADLTLSGSPLWVLESILADARNRDRSVDKQEVHRLRAGERPPQKPRGHPPRTSSPGSPRMLLPQGRAFAREEHHEAVKFLQELFDAGHAVLIRPKRQAP